VGVLLDLLIPGHQHRIAVAGSGDDDLVSRVAVKRRRQAAAFCQDGSRQLGQVEAACVSRSVGIPCFPRAERVADFLEDAASQASLRRRRPAWHHFGHRTATLGNHHGRLRPGFAASGVAFRNARVALRGDDDRHLAWARHGPTSRRFLIPQ
jgi:hypothetical protein